MKNAWSTAAKSLAEPNARARARRARAPDTPPIMRAMAASRRSPRRAGGASSGRVSSARWFGLARSRERRGGSLPALPISRIAMKSRGLSPAFSPDPFPPLPTARRSRWNTHGHCTGTTTGRDPRSGGRVRPSTPCLLGHRITQHAPTLHRRRRKPRARLLACHG